MYRNTLDLAQQKLLDYIPSRCINQDELCGAKSKKKNNDYTIHHDIFR